MEQQNNVDNKLQEPINFTDPYVLHDVELTKPAIVHFFTQTDMQADENENGNNTETSSIKTHGILYPLIQINTKVIDYTQITKMSIYYDSFLPEIRLVVFDPGELMQRTDLPGLNNTLKVIIVPEVENVYKTIALEFKITDYKTNGEYITYYGKCKIPGFNKIITNELIYQGCANKKGTTKDKEDDPTVIEDHGEDDYYKQHLVTNDTSSNESNDSIGCNPNPNTKPNMWETLHIIANECQLGFSSTDKCQDIEDRLPRLMFGESYEDFIINQLDHSGIDENSVFDAWVDLYGYLVMVNVSWVLNNDKVTTDNLGIYAFTGIHGTDDTGEPEQESELVHRTLTNYTQTGTQNNLSFRNFEFFINNNDLVFGTSVSMYNFGLTDINAGNNSISQYDVDVIRNDVDDQKIEEYGVQTRLNMVIECNEIQINRQRLIRDKFFSKHRQRILQIKLVKLNLGLERGTLVNVMIFEENERNKQFALTQASNALATEPVDPTTSTPEDIKQDGGNDMEGDDMDVITDENYEVPNIALSGIYYIDGMKFEYSYETNEITQYLLLIKKDNLNSLSNLTTLTKINTTILENGQTAGRVENQNQNNEPATPQSTEQTITKSKQC